MFHVRAPTIRAGDLDRSRRSGIDELVLDRHDDGHFAEDHSNTTDVMAAEQREAILQRQRLEPGTTVRVFDGNGRDHVLCRPLRARQEIQFMSHERPHRLDRALGVRG